MSMSMPIIIMMARIDGDSLGYLWRSRGEKKRRRWILVPARRRRYERESYLFTYAVCNGRYCNYTHARRQSQSLRRPVPPPPPNKKKHSQRRE